MIQRPDYLSRLKTALGRSPVTALLGPRQCGKTTLARQLSEHQKSTFFDIESLPDRRRLQNPELMLGSLTDLVVLDEIQEMPELFQVLRVLVDRPDNQARFLILGSASPEIIKSASESLAGRLEFIELQGFDLSETGANSWRSSGCAAAFRALFLLILMRIVWRGERDLSGPSWNATFPSWGLVFHPLRCAASGLCLPIITGKLGMLLKLAARWVFRIKRFDPISTF